MPYRFPKNSAVDFEAQYTEALVNERDCYYIPYCHPIKEGDITGVQVYQDEQPIQVASLWDFSSETSEQWTGGAGWTFTTPANYWAGSATNNALTYSSIIQPSGVYRVTFTISGYSAGDVTPQIGTNAGTAVSGNGTFTQTIQSVDNSVGDFNINGNAFTGNIDDIRLEFLYYLSAFSSSASGYTSGSFTLTGGVMNHVNGGGTSALTQDLLSAGQVYRVTVEVQNHTFGTITIAGGTQEFGVIAENVNGTFEVYGIAQDTDLNFTPTDDLIADIVSIKVEKLYAGSLFGICTADCELVEFLDTTEYIEQVNDVIPIQVDWELHALNQNICYRLCYFDAEENCLTESGILNASLDDSSFWVLPSGTSIAGNAIVVTAPTALDARIRNVAEICQNTKYNVQFLLNMSGGGGGEYVIVNVGGTASTPITASTNVNIDIVSGVGNEFNFQVNDDGGSIIIQNIIVTAVIDEDTEPTVCSNCFQFVSGFSVYLTWNNEYPNAEPARDAFDFKYKDYPTYINSYRADGKLQDIYYPADSEYDTTEARVFNYSFADIKTSKTFAASKIPTWMLRSLAMAMYHNNFQIDGTKYINNSGDVKPTEVNCLMGNIEVELLESGNKNVNQC